MILEYGVSFGSQTEEIEQEVAEKGQKACFIAVGQKLMGVIIVADRVRSDAETALSSLKQMKLHLGVLTGDGPVSAAFVANAVDVNPESVHSELIPEEKSGLLQHYRQRFGPVGHVGDGVNDSLALAAADVGIAMGVGGSTMAVEAADVALFSNNISSIYTAIKISQKVRSIIIENIIFSVSVKVAVILLAFLWHAHLWYAVAADVGSALLVILNGLRMLNCEAIRKGSDHDYCAYQAMREQEETLFHSPQKDSSDLRKALERDIELSAVQRKGQRSSAKCGCCSHHPPPSQSKTHLSECSTGHTECCGHKHDISEHSLI